MKALQNLKIYSISIDQNIIFKRPYTDLRSHNRKKF